MRATEFITELFRPGNQNWKWNRRSQDEAVANFTVGKRIYVWRATNHHLDDKPETWEIQFRLTRAALDTEKLDLFGTTGTGNSAEVMSIVVDIFREFLQDYGDNVQKIVFDAKENSRIALYRKMIQRLIPNWDLDQDYNADTGLRFSLTRPKKVDERVVNQLSDFTLEVEPYEGWNGMGIIIRAYDEDTEIGHVIFEPTEEDETQWYAIDVEVDEKYQRRGIATAMYNKAKNIAKQEGAIIVRSHAQSQAGQGLWQDKKVWENIVN